jgi:O-6-methylguanine DNA methyltransferase
MTVVVDDHAVVAVAFSDDGDHPLLPPDATIDDCRTPLLDAVLDALAAYARGESHLPSLPLALGHLPPFTRQVLDHTARIPFGHRETYGSVARALGKPQASRAVGQALGRNPVPILIPCHRVLGSSGLGGFTPGTGIKLRLLAHEGIAVG